MFLRRQRRPLVLTAVLAVALLAASCARTVDGSAIPADALGTQPAPSGDDTHQITEPPTDGSGTQSPTGPAATTTTSGADPDALQHFYDQQLDWGDCRPYATNADERSAYGNPELQCAYLTVPLDYSDPAGQTIRIGVLRHQSTGDRIGSLIVNPGGPGASGMYTIAMLAQYGIGSTLRDRFDLVGFDPRGVESSQPRIACQTDAQRDAGRAQGWPGFMPSRTAAEVDAANAATKQFVADCLSTISAEGVDATAFLAHVGTVDVAKDLDMLRAVLGDQKLSYIGWSYGTSIGTQYAEQFPSHVRAMVLDGAVDPAVDTATDALEQTTAFQQAFDSFAAWCAGKSHCPWQDARDANSRFQAMAQPLMDTQLPLPDGRSLGFLDAATGVASALYSDSWWPTLLGALDDLAHGKGAALMALADEYFERDSSGHYSSLQEAFPAIRCMDSDRITDPGEVTRLNAKLIAASPFQDNGQPAAAIFDVCSYWPVAPTLLPHTPDPQGLAPVLVISTVGDPATPYQSGVNLAKDLGGSLLTVEGTRHAGYLMSGSSCVDDIGDRYLIDLRLPAEGTRCAS